MDEVEQFIRRRFRGDNNWLSGNCLWFSLILKKRFPGGRIYYLPIQGHFVYMYHGEYYDWCGKTIKAGNRSLETKRLLSSIKKDDPNWYNRLIDNCLK